ncbi:MAG: menaquinone biosynthesis protein [Desulfobacterales bacterium]|nr:menaquinone biosynthesis protein [Desulfobacterales bacterium]
MDLKTPAFDNPVRIGRISYMNVAPIYYGLDRQCDPAWGHIVSAPPAVLNRKMAAGELDISPVSTAAYAEHQDDWMILPDLSISCDGPVMSVVLASRYSLRELHGKTVAVSDESASAAALLRLIFKEHNVRPEIACRKIDDGKSLAKADAVLVIGDAALNGKWQKSYKYVWDLCGAWKDATGLPFVFALWAVRKQYAREHADRVAATFKLLNQSRRKGCANLAAITASLKDRCDLEMNILKRYFNGLEYDLDAAKLKGLQAFYAKLYQYGLIPAPVKPCFIDLEHQDITDCASRDMDGIPVSLAAI